ncbi:uncharacterized protein LOC113783344 [Coffea eugenioides]|uniref:Uncharacterized protein LOC113710565 n=1 Tax=Coffea arabica TaxID=13443 RepID=A0A6P6UG74_COFAR|nr:uncharacterized protein LOC113710565 [Coffea arabica]XP_027089448.1 uncharacterized protein LOC113710565 [Coffea arabica]XP_027185252.1 uncharacterized protein LOC113783344 [Coffea eugenioides]XP_027185253.1 uncharacterized protein LOC113783344 [Coffea eugenioides]
MTNDGAAHLVYVRRKPDPPHLPPASSDPHQPPIPALDSESPPGKSVHHQYQSSSENISGPNQVSPGISSSMRTPPAPTKLTAIPAATPITHWENDPSCKLNNSLHKLDRSDQKDYIEMLRSLSSVELSKHAVELEKRSIQLSLEEAKELQRVQALDVLERYSKHSRVPSNQQNM